MRFILFSGEERTLGSRMYSVAHRNELDKAPGSSSSMRGLGRQHRFLPVERKDVVLSAEALLAARAIRGGQADSDGGSWHRSLDFMLEGVPNRR